MNKPALKILHALALGGWLLAGCSTPGKGGGQAEVTFINPERFTDVQLSDSTAVESRAELLPEIESFIEDQATRQLRAGRRLEVRILDIDMAGTMSLTRGRMMRVVGDTFPARIELDYTLSDAGGAVVKSGRETLQGYAGDNRQSTGRLELEKDLLRSWMRRLSAL